MVDTMILTFALKAPPVSDSAAVNNFQVMKSNSLNLLNQLEVIHVSALCWMEFKRVNRFSEAEKKVLASYENRVFVHALEAPMSEAAAELLQKHRSKAGVCPRCLNSKDASPCPGCKSLKGKSFKVMDALTVATASATDGIDVLYTYDDGMIQLASLIGLVSKRPPDKDGPLFEYLRKKENAGTVLPISSPAGSTDET
jgi:hypothetical protein